MYVSLCLIVIRTECKKRWKSVRDHYMREKKEGKGTGKAAKELFTGIA